MNFSSCIKKVIQNEGLESLWRGNGVNIIRYVPQTAINFGLKEKFQIYMCPYDWKTEKYKYLFGKILSGGSAGIVSSLLVFPLD